jgi:hypothetical protein
MNIRILAASALALAILIPAANAATPSRKVTAETHSGFDKCPGGDAYMNLGTGECKIFNWVSPKKHKVIFVKKTDSKWNSNLSRGTGNHPIQL